MQKYFKDLLNAFFLALTFLTIIPLPFNINFSYLRQRKSFIFYPLIGTILGLIQYLLVHLFSNFLTYSISILFSMIIITFITGALHEDAIADVFDGFGSSKDPNKILEVMKDSSVGTYGILALIFIKLTIFLSLHEVQLSLLFSLLILSQSYSRFLMLIPMQTLHYVSNDKSKSQSLIEKMALDDWLLTLLFLLLPILINWNLKIFFPIMIALSLTILMTFYYKKRLGGYNGDCLGAVQQISDLAIILSFLIFY